MISEDPTTNFLHPPGGNPHGNPGNWFSYHGNQTGPPSTATWSNRKSFATLDRSSFTGSSFNDVITNHNDVIIVENEGNFVNGGEKVNLGLKEAKKLNEQPVMVMKECDSVVATSFQTHSGKFFCLTRPKSISTASESSPPKENPPNRNKYKKSEVGDPAA